MQVLSLILALLLQTTGSEQSRAVEAAPPPADVCLTNACSKGLIPDTAMLPQPEKSESVLMRLRLDASSADIIAALQEEAAAKPETAPFYERFISSIEAVGSLKMGTSPNGAIEILRLGANGFLQGMMTIAGAR